MGINPFNNIDYQEEFIFFDKLYKDDKSLKVLKYFKLIREKNLDKKSLKNILNEDEYNLILKYFFNDLNKENRIYRYGIFDNYEEILKINYILIKIYKAFLIKK